VISLQNALNNLTVDQLKLRLKLITKAPKLIRKQEIISFLSNELLSNNLNHYWERLSDLEQKAVSEAIYSYEDGAFNRNKFIAKYEKLPTYFSSNSRSGQQCALSLFFYQDLLAAELADSCKSLVDSPEHFQLTRYSIEEIKDYAKNQQKELNQYHENYQPELTVLSMETTAIHDLQAVLNLIEGGKISVSEKTKIAGSATVKKITAILLEGDFYSEQDVWDLDDDTGGAIYPIRAYAWPLLLQSTGLGLVRRVGTKLQLTTKGKKVSKSPIEESLRLIYQCWREKGLLDEFNRITVIKGQTGKGQRLYPLARRRLVIEQALKACPENEWIAVEDFFRFMQIEDFDLRVIWDHWKLYISDSRYGCLAYSSCPFEVIEGRYILAYLFEYLATLGMIDVAYLPPYYIRDDYKQLQETYDLSFFSQYDGLLFFRINPLGSYCLQKNDEYQPPKQSISLLLATDDNLKLTLQRNATPTEKLILDQFLLPETERTYQLDQHFLLQAIEQGGDLTVFINFLNEVSEQPLAKSILDELVVVEERCHALTDVGNARLLNCSSIALAKMLADDPNTGKHCIHAHDKLLVIPEKSDKAFQKATKKLGYIIPKKSC